MYFSASNSPYKMQNTINSINKNANIASEPLLLLKSISLR